MSTWVGPALQAGGSVLGAVAGGLLGGSKGYSRESQRRSRITDALYQYHTVSHHAPRYGIHPLSAMGLQPWQTGSTGIGKDYTNLGSKLGSSIGQAAGDIGNRPKVEKAEATAKALADAQIETEKARANYYDSEAVKNRVDSHAQLMARDSVNNRNAQTRNAQQDGLNPANPYPNPVVEPMRLSGTGNKPVPFYTDGKKQGEIPARQSDLRARGEQYGDEVIEWFEGLPRYLDQQFKPRVKRYWKDEWKKWKNDKRSWSNRKYYRGSTPRSMQEYNNRRY